MGGWLNYAFNASAYMNEIDAHKRPNDACQLLQGAAASVLLSDFGLT